MAIDMKLIEKIDAKKRHQRLMNNYALTLLSIGYVSPTGKNIASLLYPGSSFNNQQAVAHWVEDEFKKLGHPKFDLNVMRIRLVNHLDDCREDISSI